jgi:hypothetical protein
VQWWQRLHACLNEQQSLYFGPVALPIQLAQKNSSQEAGVALGLLTEISHINERRNSISDCGCPILASSTFGLHFLMRMIIIAEQHLED